MLTELTLRNLGVIKEATLPLGPHFNVLTGETGSGKTIVLTGLGLLLGRRVDPGLVRPGEKQALVEAAWAIEEDSSHVARVEGAGGEVEDGELLVSRSVNEDGKSRAVLGGRSVPAKTLGGVTGSLVNIHGQADQLRLRSAEAQREALDRFIGEPLVKPLAKYKASYKELKKAEARLKDLAENRAARHREYLQAQAFMEDFNHLDPQEGEIEALEKEIDRLGHLDRLREGVGQAYGALDPQNEDAFPPADALASTLRTLQKLVHFDPRLEEVVDAVREAASALDVSVDLLHSYGASLDEDGLERLYEAQERKQHLSAFLKKHRLTLEDAFVYAEEASARIVELDPEANSVEALEDEVKNLTELASKNGATVSKLRQSGAKKLSALVNGELEGLAMGGVKFSVHLDPMLPSTHGLEEVSLRVTQPGASTAHPIGRAASGGELSRIMLALEVVLADPSSTPTYVFDEVDAGVGGATAIEIGKRLAKLADEGAQVIVVTHLPQVAAFARTHLKVTKKTLKGKAHTTVQDLDKDERVKEITRLLSGLEDSSAGQAHAEELLALGAAAR